MTCNLFETRKMVRHFFFNTIGTFKLVQFLFIYFSTLYEYNFNIDIWLNNYFGVVEIIYQDLSLDREITEPAVANEIRRITCTE